MGLQFRTNILHIAVERVFHRTIEQHDDQCLFLRHRKGGLLRRRRLGNSPCRRPRAREDRIRPPAIRRWDLRRPLRCHWRPAQAQKPSLPQGGNGPRQLCGAAAAAGAATWTAAGMRARARSSCAFATRPEHAAPNRSSWRCIASRGRLDWPRPWPSSGPRRALRVRGWRGGTRLGRSPWSNTPGSKGILRRWPAELLARCAWKTSGYSAGSRRFHQFIDDHLRVSVAGSAAEDVHQQRRGAIRSGAGRPARQHFDAIAGRLRSAGPFA